MLKMLPEVKAEMKAHLEAVARILRQHTEPEKLQDFESIEIEVRKQVQEEVTPRIGEFFFQKGAREEGENREG